MKKEQDEIKLDIHDKFFTKDGKFYIQKSVGNRDNGDELAFVQVNRKEYDALIEKLAKELLERSKLSPHLVIAQALRYLSLAELKAIERKLKKKKPVRIAKGCVEIKVGSSTIPIC